MRIAVISDIHGNCHALETVLAAIEKQKPDEIWCLGDLVGYGPSPNECCARSSTNGPLAASSATTTSAFSARSTSTSSARMPPTPHSGRGRCSTETAGAYLRRLEPSGAGERSELFHGSPRDPVWDYVLTDDAARESLELTAAPLVLVGHSHVALAIVQPGGRRPDGGPRPRRHASSI